MDYILRGDVLGNDLIKEIHSNLRQNISNHRYNHTMGVIKSAVYLAKKYGENEKDAYLAALLHDYAKYFTREEIYEYVRQKDIQIDDIMSNVYELLHGKIAAHIAQNQYGIKDQNILNAIEYHTTGRKNMSKLEKIIYLADFIEPGREYSGVVRLREVADENLDRAVLLALNNTIKFVIHIEKILHTNTIEARNTLLLEGI